MGGRRASPDYIADRERETGERFVGIASDGLRWAVFERQGDALITRAKKILDPEKGAEFLAWLGGAIAIPVYLGDALQLSIRPMMDTQELIIGALHAASLAGWTRKQVETQLEQVMHEHFVRIAGLRRAKEIGRVEELAISELGTAYETYDELRREKCNSIWSYVARNLSRPLALSAGGGWANVVVGNPPWLAFRYMNGDLQKRLRERANAERVYMGGRFATQNDLFALFTVRAASLYLRSGGKIAFVLQLAALTRCQFEKLRTGAFASVKIAWDETWTVEPVSARCLCRRASYSGANAPKPISAAEVARRVRCIGIDSGGMLDPRRIGYRAQIVLERIGLPGRGVLPDRNSE